MTKDFALLMNYADELGRIDYPPVTSPEAIDLLYAEVGDHMDRAITAIRKFCGETFYEDPPEPNCIPVYTMEELVDAVNAGTF